MSTVLRGLCHLVAGSSLRTCPPTPLRFALPFVTHSKIAPAGDLVLVAVSGGADSLALAYALSLEAPKARTSC